MKHNYCLKPNSNVDVREILKGFGLKVYLPCNRASTKCTVIWDDGEFTTMTRACFANSIHSTHTLFFTEPDEFIAAVNKYILKQIPVKLEETEMTATTTVKTIKTIEIKEITTQPQKQEVWVDEVVEVPNPELKDGLLFKCGEILECINDWNHSALSIGDFYEVVEVPYTSGIVRVKNSKGNYKGYDTGFIEQSRFKRAKSIESYKQITQQEAIEMAINGKLDQVYNKSINDWGEMPVAIPSDNAASILSESSYMFYVKETKYESIPNTIKTVTKVKKVVTETINTKRHVVFVDGKEVGDLKDTSFINISYNSCEIQITK